MKNNKNNLDEIDFFFMGILVGIALIFIINIFIMLGWNIDRPKSL